MHTYTARWPEKFDADARPNIDEFRFNDALDVVAWAELDRLVGHWRNWPETFHIDETGRFHCYDKSGTGATVRQFAEDPTYFEDSRLGFLEGGCPPRWFIVESRPRCVYEDEQQPTEGDVAAFMALRRRVAARGIALVDDIVFDDAFHWWSMQELVSGSTAWPSTAELLGRV